MRSLRAVIVALVGCTSNGAPPTCGPGTLLQGNECVGTPLSCGLGTHEDNGTCLPDAPAAFQIRATTKIIADGTTPSAIVAFGSHLDGSPATDPIVFGTDRPGSGDFTPPNLTLDERGGVATFVPCASTTPGCLGPLRLTIALASAPMTPVAQFDVELIAPPGVGSAEHCPAGSNILYFDGGGFVYGGKLTVTDATFDKVAGNERALVNVAPTNPIQGTTWSLEFSTVQLATPMVPGVYQNGQQVAGGNRPGINITGATPYASCRQSTQGEFQVFDYTYTTSLQHMTVSFREWCPDFPNVVLSGCVHLE